MPCREPNDALFRNTGVVGRSSPPIEPELGALRGKGFVEWTGPDVPGTSGTAIVGGIGDEGGNGVVESEMRFRASTSSVSDLFVDMEELLFEE